MIDTGHLGVGENLFHFGGVRVRVNGSGTLNLEFQSFDNVETSDLVGLTMSPAINREKFTLGNFIEQRAFLKISTSNIDEHFEIARVIVFARPVWSQFSDE